MLSEIRAVVFDWAGTLVDQGACAPTEAFISVFAAEGVSVAPAEARLPMGIAKQDHIHSLLDLPGVAARWRACKGQAPTKADFDRLYAALEPALEAAARHHSDVIAGAVAILRDLRRWGIKIGATTGYSRRAIAPLIDAAAQQGLEVQAIVCAGETPQSRPYPDQMHEALRRLGIDEPHRCIKVDDTLSGLREGITCGAWTIGVTLSGNAAGLSQADLARTPSDALNAIRRTAESHLDASGAHYLVDSIADLMSPLQDIARRLAHGEHPQA